MTHCAEGLLRAYADAELLPPARVAVERHLAACPLCRGQLFEISTDAAWASGRLAGPVAVEEPLPGLAWPRVRAVWGATPLGPAPRRAGPPRPPRWALRPAAAAAVAALAAGALTLAPVRAAAGQFLQLFRVQSLQVVNVTPADLTAIQSALQSDGAVVNVKGLARVRVTPNTGLQPVPLAAAAGDVGFPLLTLPAAASGYTLGQVQVQPAFSVEFDQLNGPAIQQLLASLGNRQALPPDLSDASITLSVPASAELSYAGAAGSVKVLETGNPALAVDLPGADVTAIRQMLLDLPFIPADLRAQLAAVGDWQQTALVPQIPGVSQAVQVGGAQGLFVQTGDAQGDQALLWLRGQAVYGVVGVLTEAQAQTLAAELH